MDDHQRGTRRTANDASSDANVVSLMPARRGVADCFAEVEAYWHSLCDGRMMPTREEIDPREMAQSLERTFLLDRVAPGVVRFRLAGRHLGDLMGMDVRGMPLTAFFVPAARANVADAVELVFCEPARVDLRLRSEAGVVRAGTSARLLILPLRDSAGEVSRAMGCLSAERVSTRTPTRFDVMADDRRTLIGYGQRQTSRTAPCTPSRPRPHLTLVSNDA